MASVRSIAACLRCPENFVWTLYPHLSKKWHVLLAWSQKACTQTVKNDSVRSLECLQALFAKSAKAAEKETVKPPCP